MEPLKKNNCTWVKTTEKQLYMENHWKKQVYMEQNHWKNNCTWNKTIEKTTIHGTKPLKKQLYMDQNHWKKQLYMEQNHWKKTSVHGK
jgi:hypothetical protein